MSLVFGAIVPHSPLLIPSIGKSNRDLLKATILSYKKVTERLIEKKVDTILIISPHSMVNPDIFTINLNPITSSDFKDFGDFSTKKNWPVDVGLAYKIREDLEANTPLQLVSNELLDHGTSVPLTLLSEQMAILKIIPLSSSSLSLQEHFDLGKKLQKKIINDKKNIAIIASGEMSHRLSKDAPAGYSPKAKKFDKKISTLLLERKIEDIINIDNNLLNEVGECGLRSFMVLAGIFNDINCQPKLMSYEAPFGVGYLVMDYNIM
ncbi:MAG: Extradiol ring-cleavage dioxygenase, class III enzyme, subunit B [Candidatus Falkowbacteria bacterium GW2011_GWC2_38_22]|uniref:Extradiol ring-cleavage dioxygenase, class III enzyme, subunit B n=1 Tax=Candidatus Falkowbacteria bacterium GW2011_GWE1_38_31 TaxID=1618638 RepID=A0A0G0MB60_9BACT|nr:MAG: Extradiol ring-cleavage dioxygenase, class III enzyme, subunit B [Candidatus Falkowbacteria bacterium GW2011_GWF2_38_1205]KKQ62139.1 MAG: Extradiol ring-cleavage dioxygenase, class III enzyme, subunit B [Candidatus Falkowbacteria bacterium GW2011_GWC2_38_22]KKQ64289.1 MAG: Extradiol ring-cleavage dioxygenase, class III enzyme, subunit B [Candidatus Falkowbacteria bacterium GW2011_GWF1_38_22]KKQ66266.1 MAG: Extradiol ring-cleavage dioxygenase, class III enzyme, subunit B [Candidatus Falko